MSDWKKSVFPAIGVIATIAAFIGGSEIRTRQDTGLAVRKIPQSYLAGIESPSETAVNVPEGELFYQLLLLLERDYVDPKIDEQKLAYGAVKGMVEGLWDPLSQFLQQDHFEEHERRLTGNFGGAGMEMRMISDGTELAKVQRGGRSSDPLLLRPILQVATVVPGGPADVAGIQVGDQILGVNQKWILGYTDVVKVRGLQKSLASGKISAVEFDRERGEFQKRAKSAISIARAEDLLDMGEGKIVPLTWSRGGREMSATLTTKTTKLTMLKKSPDGSYRLRLFNSFGLTKPALDAYFPVNRVGFRKTVINRLPQRVERNLTFAVPLCSADFRSAQPSGATEFNALSSKVHGRLDRLFHRAAEADPAFDLKGDVFRHKLGIKLGGLDFLNVNFY